MSDYNKELEILFKKYQSYAQQNGLQLNPNKEIVDYLLTALLERKKKYGKEYCPCRRINNISSYNETIICPCIYHKKEIQELGHCRCYLFVKQT